MLCGVSLELGNVEFVCGLPDYHKGKCVAILETPYGQRVSVLWDALEGLDDED